MTKIAVLYRMSTSQHICPFGLKSRDLLRRKGFQIEDKRLKTREQTDQFKSEHDVETTPQTFIDGKRIGGYDALRKYFDLPPTRNNGITYTPVIATFVTALCMAVAIVIRGASDFSLIFALEQFVAISMCILAVFKLRDLFAFSNQFITYDLLAMRYVPYAYVYPFLEAYAGIAMLAHFPAWSFAPVALVIGTIGAISVFKAVYLDKRELKCACVGGNSNVPLGFISLSENLFMIGAGLWMFLK